MKLILLFLFSLNILLQSNAQTFKIKPTVGFNLTFQNPEFTFNNKVKNGFDIGLLVEKDIKKNFSIELGILFSKSRFSLERTRNFRDLSNNIIFYDIKENIQLSFIKIPVLFNVKQAKNNPFSLGLGVLVKTNTFSFTRASQKINSHPPQNYNYEYNSNYNFGIGFQAVVKKEFSYFNKKFAAGLYFDSDLSTWRYYEKAKDPPFDDGFKTRAKNISFLLSIIL